MVAALTALTPKFAQPRIATPGDSLQLGVHTAIKNSSLHKKMVSGALHLKRESIGKKIKPTAFKAGPKAFSIRTKGIA